MAAVVNTVEPPRSIELGSALNAEIPTAGLTVSERVVFVGAP